MSDRHKKKIWRRFRGNRAWGGIGGILGEFCSRNLAQNHVFQISGVAQDNMAPRKGANSEPVQVESG